MSSRTPRRAKKVAEPEPSPKSNKRTKRGVEKVTKGVQAIDINDGIQEDAEKLEEGVNEEVEVDQDREVEDQEEDIETSDDSDQEEPNISEQDTSMDKTITDSSPSKEARAKRRGPKIKGCSYAYTEGIR